jgi:hypothetical protein
MEKKVTGWKPSQRNSAEVAWNTAEEILVKVDRHGKPVTAKPDDCRVSAPQGESRWYRGRNALSSSGRMKDVLF